MENVFIEVLNLTLPGTLFIAALLILRVIYNKFPKNLNLFMWAMVFVRLMFPIKLESPVSLMPRSDTIPKDIMISHKPSIDSGINFVNDAVNPVLSTSLAPNVSDSVNPLQVIMFVLSL